MQAIKETISIEMLESALKLRFFKIPATPSPKIAIVTADIHVSFGNIDVIKIVAIPKYICAPILRFS